MQSIRAPTLSRARPTVARPQARRAVTVRAALDTSLVMGASTWAFLALGRFVFLPYQRREGEWDAKVGPKTTGNSYFDNLSKPNNFLLTTNDPAGFTIIDVAAWGSLGHVAGFSLLSHAGSVLVQ